MTSPSPIELLAEVLKLGGRLAVKPPGTLSVDLPAGQSARLVPLLRAAKLELMRLLGQPPAEPCAACGGRYWWRATQAGPWTCGNCQPDPRGRRLQGVTLETLADRAITLTPPASDLPVPGSWARTPAGAAVELVLFEQAGNEVLTRELRSGSLAWFKPGELRWESDWEWRA
ncbi:MAG: hypothetical protein ACRD1A_01885 [Terriglobales bacterium]